MTQLFALFLLATLFTSGFAFAPNPQIKRVTPPTCLYGWLDSMLKPWHGHPGKLHQEDLDTLFQDQQKLLQERKAHHIDKQHLHQKYARSKEGFLESLLHPIHGSGSATSSELDEMWKAQQELLYTRREYGKSHAQLKKKYFHKSHDDLEAQRHNENVAWEKSHAKGNPMFMNQKEDDAMYIDDSSGPFLNFKMPWNNKFKP